jgi:hypothetical protein
MLKIMDIKLIKKFCEPLHRFKILGFKKTWFKFLVKIECVRKVSVHLYNVLEVN